jgi:ankyrin repeat protein
VRGCNLNSMSITPHSSADEWISRARDFAARKNWVGALSSVRNALRLDVQSLPAWRVGLEILIAQERRSEARKFARALKRFANKAGKHDELRFADKHIAEIEQYFATYHRQMGETDLTHFAARGAIDKVRILLESGAGPNERNRSNWTPLHCVAMRGQPEVARLLVLHGADLEAADTLNETPLITACRFANAKMVPALIELGASVNHVAREKHTALWYAISSMKDIEIVKLLIESGADANEKYEFGENPFLLSVFAQEAAVTDFLLPLTTDPARMDEHEVSALHFAASYDDVRLIEQLIARGVPVDLVTPSGVTALMNAARSNSIKAARVLLAHGARINLKSIYGDTAISLAEHSGHRTIHELLVAADARDS